MARFADWSHQWPENYDFESTRALNAPKGLKLTNGASMPIPPSPDMDEKKRTSAEVAEVSEDDGHVVQPDPDLDPAALKKAYRFAQLSSVALVRSLVSRAVAG